jgi:predicted TIM-barrel fold metal-dependent hydrolase
MTLPPVIDAHHHLWDLRRHRYPWLQGEVRPTHFGDYAAIRRDYLVGDYLADIEGQNVRKSVHVEAGFDPADPVAETRWLQSVADEHGYPHAIVARVDLTREDAADVLAGHSRFANLRGVRMMARRPDQIAAGAAGPSIFVDPGFRRNFALLGAHVLTFDLQAPVPLMADAAALAADFPATNIVLTHVGLPLDRSEHGMAAWRSGIAALAACPNVCCKLSGVPMTDHAWTEARLRPILLHAIGAFGADRCMVGSNFPVDKLFSSFSRLFNATRSIIAPLRPQAVQAILCRTAARVYRL